MQVLLLTVAAHSLFKYMSLLHLMHDIFSWWKDKNIVTRHSRHTRHTQFKTFTIAQ